MALVVSCLLYLVKRMKLIIFLLMKIYFLQYKKMKDKMCG